MEKYVKQLLQLHSKVILPQFGAIVLSDEETGALMFNEYLTYDDGKIVELIRSEENIDQEKAKSKVEKLVQDIKSKFEKGESYSLGDLGVFNKVDDKISFQGNLKTGKSIPPAAKKDSEEKSKEAKKNIYVEKNENSSTPQDKDMKKPEEKKLTPADQLKKEKVEKKKAEKERKLKEKADRKNKKLEEKKKYKAEKNRLIKEKAEKKKATLDKKIAAAKEAKTKSSVDKNAIIGASSAASATSKKDDKKEIENRKKAEKERRRMEKEARKRKELEKKNNRKAEKERLRNEKKKKVVTPIKAGATTTKNPPKEKIKKTKEEGRKRKPIFWILLVLIILILIGGIWIALNYEKVEAYMGWNKFENVDATNDDQSANKEINGSIPIIDSLETAEESDSLDQSIANDTLVDTKTPVDSKANQSDAQPSLPAASSTGAYHIVVGGFQVLSNAENLVQSLKGKGYGSKMLDGTFTGLELHLVAAQNYSSLSDAKADLQRIKQEVNDGAWIFKH